MRVAARRWAAPILGALVGAVGPAWTRAEERPASLGPRVARVRSHEVPIPTSVDSRETMQALLREDRDDVPYLARRPLLICSGNSNRNLAGHIASHLESPLEDVRIGRFADGEVNVLSKADVRGRDVFIVQSTSRPVNEHLLELLLMVTALRRASADRITAVIPYYGYKRSTGTPPAALNTLSAKLLASAEKARRSSSKDKSGKRAGQLTRYSGGETLLEVNPISAADIAILLEMAGVDAVMTVDVQLPGGGQIEGYFAPRTAVDNIRATGTVITTIAREDLHNPVVIAPHEGCLMLAQDFQTGLQSLRGTPVGLGLIVEDTAPSHDDAHHHSTHSHGLSSSSTVTRRMQLVGSVEGSDVVIVDDMIDTGRSLVARARMLKQLGARRIIAFATHPLLSGEALRRVEESPVDMLFVTDTISLTENRDHEFVVSARHSRKISVISVAPLVALAIRRVHDSHSIKDLRGYGRWSETAAAAAVSASAVTSE